MSRHEQWEIFMLPWGITTHREDVLLHGWPWEDGLLANTIRGAHAECLYKSPAPKAIRELLRQRMF